VKSFPEVKFETVKGNKLQPALELAKAEKLNHGKRHINPTMPIRNQELKELKIQDIRPEETRSYISPSFNTN